MKICHSENLHQKIGNVRMLIRRFSPSLAASFLAQRSREESEDFCMRCCEKRVRSGGGGGFYRESKNRACTPEIH